MTIVERYGELEKIELGSHSSRLFPLYKELEEIYYTLMGVKSGSAFVSNKTVINADDPLIDDFVALSQEHIGLQYSKNSSMRARKAKPFMLFYILYKHGAGLSAYLSDYNDKKEVTYDVHRIIKEHMPDDFEDGLCVKYTPHDKRQMFRQLRKATSSVRQPDVDEVFAGRQRVLVLYESESVDVDVVISIGLNVYTVRCHKVVCAVSRRTDEIYRFLVMDTGDNLDRAYVPFKEKLPTLFAFDEVKDVLIDVNDRAIGRYERYVDALSTIIAEIKDKYSTTLTLMRLSK